MCNLSVQFLVYYLHPLEMASLPDSRRLNSIMCGRRRTNLYEQTKSFWIDFFTDSDVMRVYDVF